MLRSKVVTVRICPLTLFIISIILEACSSPIIPPLPPTPTAAQPTAAITATIAYTSSPVPSPTPAPLGSPENPILMGVIPAKANPQAASDAAALAQSLSQKTGYSVQAVIGESYPAMLKGLANHQIQIAWLPPYAYLQAKQEGSADVALMTNHFGVYLYGTQFLANGANQFTSYFDPSTARSTADAAHALRQFAGKRPCWVSPSSSSGFVVPIGVLGLESIQTLDPVITQDHTSVIRSLYIQGICDFGATFAISGDPRTDETILKDLPDVKEKVVVIWQTDAVIPNLNVSFATGVPNAIRVKMVDALNALARTDDGKKALTAATQYEISDLKTIDDSFYDPFRTFVQASGFDLTTLVSISNP